MHDSLTDIIMRLVRRKALFLTALAALGVVGIVIAHGWSWMTAAIVVGGILVMAMFWTLLLFWIWVFRSVGQPREHQ